MKKQLFYKTKKHLLLFLTVFLGSITTFAQFGPPLATQWTGATNTDWNTATNWDSGSVPLATEAVDITSYDGATVFPVIVSGTHIAIGHLTIGGAATLTINDGGDLTVDPGASLTIIGAGILTINPGGSLISKSTFSGDGSLIYKRHLFTANWYLLSNPFSGHSINTFTVTDVATNAIATSGTNYGVAPYDNNGTAWDYYTTAAGTNDIAGAGNFIAGKGYSMKRTSAGDVEFKGTMPNTDVDIAITDGTANELNLIGNPYPSYIPANTNADAANNILTVNSAQLQENTLWFWDEESITYKIVNLGTASRFIAPAQGFFVNAQIGGGTFSFTEAMQSHQAYDEFNRTTNNRFEINLAMTDGTATKNTEIYYINGTTTSFDNGYDSSIFGGANNDFMVYTQTVSDSQGRKLGIQSLPDADYENMTIPVGVNAVAGTEITFSIAAQNIPSGMDIYLENRTDNTFTKLNDNGNYTIILDVDSNGVGQFYLRTSSSALGLETVALEGVSMYSTNKETLRIIGLQSGKATVKMFTLLGKQVIQTSFESTGVKDVSLPKVSAGVYLVNLQTAQGTLTKKIIIQ